MIILLGWLLYGVGILLIQIEHSNAGLAAIPIAMLCHWRWWVVAIPVGVASFLIGAR